jgi:hypothetical protein
VQGGSKHRVSFGQSGVRAAHVQRLLPYPPHHAASQAQISLSVQSKLSIAITATFASLCKLTTKTLRKPYATCVLTVQ